MNTTRKSIEKIKSLGQLECKKDLIDYCNNNIFRKLVPYYVHVFGVKFCSLNLSKEDFEFLNNRKKKVSVITVNYNNKDGLKRTIDSVVNQTAIDDIQFIVVDGNSDDGSLDYLKSVESKIDIAVYGNDKNVYDAMNRGIKIANSDYSIFMNSGDCFYSKDTIKDIIKISEENKNPDFIFGSANLGNNKTWIANEPENIWKGMICCHQSSLFNTKIIKDLGGYSLENIVVSDYQLIAKLYANKALFHKTELIISTIEPVGISSDFNTRTIERWKVIRELSIPNVSLSEIDEFYRDLITTGGEWAAPHFHNVNKAQSQLISNVEKRVCFLISMPRSGSTLLQRIIDRSDDIATAGEPWFMLPLVSMYSNELIDAKYGQHLNVMAKDEFIKDSELTEIITNAQRVYADSIYSTAVAKYGKRYFLDKTPRYVHIVDQLSKIYPNAKFIVLKRNPASVISSYATTWYGNDYQKVVEDRYAKYDFEKGFQKLAEFCNSTFSNKLVISYEDLVSSPEETASQIFKYLGVKFDESFLNYNQGKDIPKYTFGDPSSVYSKSRPDPTHNDKWLKSIKDHKHAKQFLTTLDLVPNKAFDMLGYDLNFIKEQVTKKFNLVLPRLVDITRQFGVKKNNNDSEILVGKGASLGVLITCYNNELTIRDSIESVLKQSKQADLILIADDLSTDNSLYVVKQVISQYKEHNIKLLERTVNVGVSKNRDEAIRTMDVDFVTTLDGDDMFYPGKLAAEYAALLIDNVAVSFSDIVILGEQGNTLIPTKPYNTISKNKMLDMLCGRKAPVPRDMMFRKSLFDKADGFDVDMEIYEDWAFKMRLIAAIDEGEYWSHSGTIGTVYDRRNPGLSGREPIVHAYGQLLGLARNVALLDNMALASGLETVAQQLQGGVKSRLLKFAKNVRSNKSLVNEINKLSTIWEERNWQLNAKQINEIIWDLSALDVKPTKFVVCTPVYNAVKTIDRTIKSVLEQEGEFDIHYHIQDGGSIDGTLNIIKDWEKRLKTGAVKPLCNKFTFTYDTGKDTGMYDALTKGLNSVSTKPSDWLTWINADDFFAPNAFKLVKKYSMQDKVSWLTGMVSVRELDGSFTRCFRPINSAIIRKGIADGSNWDFVQQEGTFFKAKQWAQINQEKFSSFKYAGDWFLWTQLAEICELYLTRVVLANFCVVEGQLSQLNRNKYINEMETHVPMTLRQERFKDFPVSEGKMYILECDKSQVKIANGSVLGQFTKKMM